MTKTTKKQRYRQCSSLHRSSCRVCLACELSVHLTHIYCLSFSCRTGSSAPYRTVPCKTPMADSPPSLPSPSILVLQSLAALRAIAIPDDYPILVNNERFFNVACSFSSCRTWLQGLFVLSLTGTQNYLSCVILLIRWKWQRRWISAVWTGLGWKFMEWCADYAVIVRSRAYGNCSAYGELLAPMA